MQRQPQTPACGERVHKGELERMRDVANALAAKSDPEIS